MLWNRIHQRGGARTSRAARAPVARGSGYRARTQVSQRGSRGPGCAIGPGGARCRPQPRHPSGLSLPPSYIHRRSREWARAPGGSCASGAFPPGAFVWENPKIDRGHTNRAGRAHAHSTHCRMRARAPGGSWGSWGPGRRRALGTPDGRKYRVGPDHLPYTRPWTWPTLYLAGHIGLPYTLP